MPNSQWKSRLKDADNQSAPLILSCAFSVLLLSIPRDYIVNGSMPAAFVIVNLVTVLAFLVILYWAFRRKPDSQHTQYVMFLAAGLLGMKAIAMVAVESEPYPFVLTVLVFAFSLFSLSRVFYAVTAGLMILSWAVVALPFLAAFQFGVTLLAMLIASALGFTILDRRIASYIQLFVLQERVGKLETLLPMCAGCKKTRDVAGEWKSVEQYLEEHDGTQVTHGICPECAKSMYGDYYKSRDAPGEA